MADLPAMLPAELQKRELSDVPLLAVVESYVRYYASGAGHTARAKRLDLQHFVGFLREYRGYSKPEKLTLADWDFSATQRFVEHLLSVGQAPSSAARRLATVKHMGRTLAERVPGFVNPAREVKPPRLQTLVPRSLEPTEIEAVREVAEARVSERNSFIRTRNRCIFDFMLETGLRADEVRLLKLGQVDRDLEWIASVRTKGRSYRNVYVGSGVREILRDYLARRELELKRFFPKLSHAQNESLPLFISTYRASAARPESFLMGAKTLWRAVNELSSDTALHPHLLRHSFALDLLDSSSDIRLVSQALGHSDVRITMRYTERRDQEIAQAIEKRARRKKKV